ncbi:hypothetical protein [Helcobacillus massiliensis]|uniref:Uncharacterized protein n=1 Tax=Helcobacillus massiliensis TaxID=521392 RepID=A0A839QW66_9MICO|nr:hypothetical protein [Helcobacillus massiliensis]MBB3023878.1 hypothetical protein [Helcobacillus massiliensis]
MPDRPRGRSGTIAILTGIGILAVGVGIIAAAALWNGHLMSLYGATSAWVGILFVLGWAVCLLGSAVFSVGLLASFVIASGASARSRAASARDLEGERIVP